MNVTSLVPHIPTIETWLREYRPDALVCGMGPTAWLLPWIDQSLLSGVRLWGCHDGCRIMPMDDLVIMDSPVMELHPISQRHTEIVKSRPKRIWLYENNAKPWEPYLNPAVKPICRTVNFSVLRPTQVPRELKHVKFKLVADPNPPHTTTISPTGMTTLAWREGCRRIGVIGVDMQRGVHHTHRWVPLVDHFFRMVAQQANEAGGLVANLSPVTALSGFAKLSRELFAPKPQEVAS